MSDRCLFSAADYAALAAIVFRPDYPGNATARGVVEAPGGDPAARDTGKRYAHVATKYVKQWVDSGAVRAFDPDVLTLFNYLQRAHDRALAVAEQLNVPERFWPDFGAGALRVLEYPPGAGSHTHTDFDLFTLLGYRSHQLLVRQSPLQELRTLDAVDPGLHLGEMGDLIDLGRATPHHVMPSVTTQHSIVYFAIPDHAAVLPGGRGTVGEWLKERLARSRYEAEGK